MPKTSRRLTVHPLTLRQVTVARVEDPTPGMRRITLAGPELDAFTSANGFAQPGFASSGFDDSVRVLFCHPGETEPLLPVQEETGLDMPRHRRLLSRAYTVRRWDRDTGEVDIDVVAHGVGVGATWASHAEPGDRVHLYGPSTSRAIPHDADWLLVAGDETALPAIARLLGELRDDARARVFVEVAEDAHRMDLRALPHVEVTWLVRNGAEAGTTTLLVDAVAKAGWWDGRPYAWCAGERTAVRDLRRHLLEERGLPTDDVESDGYWRRGELVAPEGGGAGLARTPFEQLHELTELVRPIAIRTAVELGVPDLISRGTTGLDDLVEVTGCDGRALGKLLRYLRAVEIVVEVAPGRYALTPVGEVLTNDFTADGLHPDGVAGREVLGIVGLTESVRTGRSSYASVTGQAFADVRAEQGYEDRYLARLAGFQPALAEAIATSGLLAEVRHLVIHSGGAGALASGFVAAHPDLRVTICALPAQADWLRRDLPDSIPDDRQRTRVGVVEQSVFEPSPAADAVLVSRAFKTLPDADAAHALRRASDNLERGGRVLLIEDTFATDDGPDEHDGEADLIALAVHGSGLRTSDELDAVVAGAGLVPRARHTVGWGTTVHELVRADAT